MQPLFYSSTKGNSVIYFLLNSYNKFKINLNRKEWLISFTINRRNYRLKAFNNFQPNLIQILSQREKEWERIIISIFNLYLNQFDYLVKLLNPQSVNQLTLLKLCSDYLAFVELKNKKATFIKYKQLNRTFLNLFESYNIDEFDSSKRNNIINVVEKNWKIKYSPKQYNELISYGNRLIKFLNSNLSTYGLKQYIYNPFQFDYNLPKSSIPRSNMHRLYTTNDYAIIRQEVINREYNMLHLLIQLILDTHMRINELIQLRVKDINLENGTICMDSVIYKAGARISLLTKTSLELLSCILNSATNKCDIEDKYIFGKLGKYLQNSPVNESMFNRQFNTIKKELKLNKFYTLYGFKHYSCFIKFQKLKEKNLPYSRIVSILQSINGHTNPQTTEIYLRNVLNIKDDTTTELINYLYQ
jgi:integrase